MDRLRIDCHLHRTARRQKERGLLEFKLVADLAVFPQEGHIEGKIKAFLAGLSLWFDIVRTVCSGCLGIRFPACRVAKLGDRVFPFSPNPTAFFMSFNASLDSVKVFPSLSY